MDLTVLLRLIIIIEFVSSAGFLLGVILRARGLTQMPFMMIGICSSYIIFAISSAYALYANLHHPVIWIHWCWLIAGTIATVTTGYYNIKWRQK